MSKSLLDIVVFFSVEVIITYLNICYHIYRLKNENRLFKDLDAFSIEANLMDYENAYKVRDI